MIIRMYELYLNLHAYIIYVSIRIRCNIIIDEHTRLMLFNTHYVCFHDFEESIVGKRCFLFWTVEEKCSQERFPIRYRHSFNISEQEQPEW